MKNLFKDHIKMSREIWNTLSRPGIHIQNDLKVL